MSDSGEPYEYVLYIDEAGDDGLKKVLPIDPDGSSEWLCIGAVLIRAENENKVDSWVANIREDIAATQSDVLHFRRLSPMKRRRACVLLAELPCRVFAVCSNKKNMRGHNNERAAKRGSEQWYYNFCVRLLMERVTDFCLRDSRKKYSNSRYVKVVFSMRGGHSYGQTKAYWEVLKAQSAAAMTYLDKRTISHEVLHFNLVDYVPHKENAGLQLADIVASAFYQASHTDGPRWSTEPAIMLEARVAKENDSAADYGLVLQPMPPTKANLTENQKLIFEHYGHVF